MATYDEDFSLPSLEDLGWEVEVLSEAPHRKPPPSPGPSDSFEFFFEDDEEELSLPAAKIDPPSPSPLPSRPLVPQSMPSERVNSPSLPPDEEEEVLEEEDYVDFTWDELGGEDDNEEEEDDVEVYDPQVSSYLEEIYKNFQGDTPSSPSSPPAPTFPQEEAFEEEEEEAFEEEEDFEEEYPGEEETPETFAPPPPLRKQAPRETQEEVAPPLKTKAQEEAQGPSLVTRLKETWIARFALFREQVAAEFKGEEAPKTLGPAPSRELALREEAPEEEEVAPAEKKSKKKKTKGQGKGPLAKLLRPFKTLYLKVVDLIFSILEGLLRFLSKIPLLGAPFKYLLKFTQILRLIATSLPLLAVVGVLVAVHFTTVPGSTTWQGPDEGVATFTSFTRGNGEVRGTITNGGPSSIEVVPQVEIYTSEWGDPASWLRPALRETCTGEPVTVDIEGEVEVAVACTPPTSGLVKVSGVLK